MMPGATPTRLRVWACYAFCMPFRSVVSRLKSNRKHRERAYHPPSNPPGQPEGRLLVATPRSPKGKGVDDDSGLRQSPAGAIEPIRVIENLRRKIRGQSRLRRSRPSAAVGGGRSGVINFSLKSPKPVYQDLLGLRRGGSRRRPSSTAPSTTVCSPSIAGTMS